MSRLRKTFFLSVVLLLLVAGSAPVAGAAKPAKMSCESLVNLGLKDTVISSATVVPVGALLPGDAAAPVSTCRVVGAISGNINFEVWLPATGWNGKFNGVGNGGLAGFINYGSMRVPHLHVAMPPPAPIPAIRRFWGMEAGPLTAPTSWLILDIARSM